MSYLSSTVSGAGTGAAAGSAAGPYGALIGGAVGALGGVLSAYEQAQSDAAKKKVLEDAAAQNNISYAQMKSEIDKYYSTAGIGTSDDVTAYKNALQSYNPDDYVYNFGDFSYGKDVSDFYDPNKDAIIKNATDAVSQSAAGSGVGRGTGAANAIATAAADKNEELYKDALSAYNSDRSEAYSEYSGYITAMQNKLNALNTGAQYNISNLGSLASDYETTQQNKISDTLALQQAQAASNSNLALAGLY